MASLDRQQASVAHLPEKMRDTSGLKCPQQIAVLERASGLEEGRLYSAKEVSGVIGLHERTITGYAGTGEIGHFAMGSRKQFCKADILEYLIRTYRPAKDGREGEVAEVAVVSGTRKEGT